jgi:hypothetical protein
MIMEKQTMGPANAGVGGDAIAERRQSVQQRGKSQL